MDDHESLVINFFSQYGFEIQKIPESEEKTPDFILISNETKFLLELKTKLDDSQHIERKEKILSQNMIHEESTILNRQNTISTRIRKASKQLSKQKEQFSADFCFVILLAAGEHSHLQMEQFRSTLLSSKDIIQLDTDNKNHICKKCYYYTNSDFYNHKNHIDGAFILGENIGQLLINNHSPNYTQLKENDLIKTFIDGVLDPVEQEKNGNAYIIDSNIDRSDSEALNYYLKEKYSLEHFLPVHWPVFTYTSRVS